MFRSGSADGGDELLQRLGALTARARELAEMQRSRVELAVALQHGMLPRDLPRPPGVRIAVGYMPANHGLNVGGDWYDAFPMSDGRIGISIGDVQGHNAQAAAFMGQVRVALRALASVTEDPGRLLGRTNDLLISLNADLFATCTFLRLDPATGVLECARAGHIPHIWATADGRSGIDDGEVGPPLGVMRGAEYPVACHRLTVGGVLVLVTDGVVEGPSLHIDDGLGQVRRLAEITAGASLGIDALVGGVMKLADTVGHEDDAAVLVIGHDVGVPWYPAPKLPPTPGGSSRGPGRTPSSGRSGPPGV
ncbi:PP2C family protein-serine/threonine phosphatase [Streptomyces xanthii]|uniref:Serine/threonine-protein phosphatase n=1 Tax=Streptomyces xanthii TaxID=2768069 RepID=A0A7H1B239_9ACTN|nr:PP2C family protein-serine/threonine phosphatase [Streptomyces xanthii]QNS02794.1 serine/threonine-protein phosphatase [Streptomyces xanthii]